MRAVKMAAAISEAAEDLAKGVFCRFDSVTDLSSATTPADNLELERLSDNPSDWEAAALAHGWSADNPASAEGYCLERGIIAGELATEEFWIVSKEAYDSLGRVSAHVAPFFGLYIWCRKETGREIERDPEIRAAAKMAVECCKNAGILRLED